MLRQDLPHLVRTRQLLSWLVLGALTLWAPNGALAVRFPSWYRVQKQRSSIRGDDIFCEVLSLHSTLLVGITSASPTTKASFNATKLPKQPHEPKKIIGYPVSDFPSSDHRHLLRDPALATVFSPAAPNHLPRLIQERSLLLQPRSQPWDTLSRTTDYTITTSSITATTSTTTRTTSLTAADTQPPNLNIDEATTAGRFASIAYCANPNTLSAWNCTRCTAVPGFVPYHIVYDTTWDLVAYAGYFPTWNAVVLSFRGTDSSNWGQWAENMRAWRTDHMYPVPDFPHALIHAGFYNLWSGSTLQSTFTLAVSELLAAHPGAKLVAVGHSMGGALAQLAALEVKLAYNRTAVTVYTFGAPRVGNLAYQQLFNTFINVSWRFTHNRDIVPSVPLQLMGFQHVAREVWEVDVEDPRVAGGVTRKLLMCDDTGEDPSCHNSACYLGLCTSIADHLSYLGLAMYGDTAEC